MNISILLRTSDYRGDHSTEVGVAVDVVPGETVEALVKRLFSATPYRSHGLRPNPFTDLIELRVVNEFEGQDGEP